MSKYVAPDKQPNNTSDKKTLDLGGFSPKKEYLTPSSSKPIRPRENESEACHETSLKQHESLPSFRWDKFSNYGELSERQKIFAQMTSVNRSQVIHSERSARLNLSKILPSTPDIYKNVFPTSLKDSNRKKIASSILRNNTDTGIEENKYIFHKADRKIVPVKIEHTVIVENENDDMSPNIESLKINNEDDELTFRQPWTIDEFISRMSKKISAKQKYMASKKSPCLHTKSIKSFDHSKSTDIISPEINYLPSETSMTENEKISNIRVKNVKKSDTMINITSTAAALTSSALEPQFLSTSTICASSRDDYSNATIHDDKKSFNEIAKQLASSNDISFSFHTTSMPEELGSSVPEPQFLISSTARLTSRDDSSKTTANDDQESFVQTSNQIASTTNVSHSFDKPAPSVSNTADGGDDFTRPSIEVDDKCKGTQNNIHRH